MFGPFAILYLFFGGVGAGCIAVCSLLDVLYVHQPFGCAAYCQGPSAPGDGRMVDFGFLAGLFLLTLGVACLMFDVGRPERALALFLSPHLTAMTFGSYALLLLEVLAALFAAVRFFYLPGVPARFVRAAEVTSVAVGVAVMVYTGVLLQSNVGVAFWRCWALPLLFAASSLSGGIAVLLAVSCFTLDAARAQRSAAVRALVAVDMVTIVAEALFAACFMGTALNSASPAAIASANSAVAGDYARTWWLGFVVCGLIVPFAVEAVVHRRARADRAGDALRCAGHAVFGALPAFSIEQRQWHTRVLVGLIAACVLVGALCLRVTVADAGQHRIIEATPGVALEYTEG